MKKFIAIMLCVFLLAGIMMPVCLAASQNGVYTAENYGNNQDSAKRSSDKSFFQKIADFFKNLFNWIKRLFSGLPKTEPKMPNVKSGTALEEKYYADGPYEVKYTQYDANDELLKTFGIYYPVNIETSADKLPAIVFVNGTGVKGSSYRYLQKQLATWGFITIATEEETSWAGNGAEASATFLEKLNNEDSLFKGKIDMENLGITGHSQGGTGVVNAITVKRYAKNYKAAVMLSAGHLANGDALGWTSDEGLINTPLIIIGSTGMFDNGGLATLENLNILYDTLPDNVTKVVARRNDQDHGGMLYAAEGYVTAWFLYLLKNDNEAAAAFLSDVPDIQTNSLYSDVRINIAD